MEQLHTSFKNKLFRLFHSLKGVNREFEIVSDEVENVNLNLHSILFRWKAVSM